MKILNSLTLRARRRLRQRGSALLVTLMVMVGLSLMGLAFVAISETESAISVNERNHTQTVALAEAGAKVVMQWFQDPATMHGQLLMPDNSDSFKTSRTLLSGNGYYKPASGGSLLCDLPYGPTPSDQFYGDESSPDIWIKPTSTTIPANFLKNVLTPTLFAGTEAGEISDIRIYAPPIIGGTLTTDGAGNKFWEGGTKYGTATIRVTAEKYDTAATPNVIARAVVRLVVAPFPLPGPTGAIQSKGSISTGGNFDVYWGSVESQASISPSKTYTALPWFDAYDLAHFERGYDSSTEWKPNTAYLGATYPLGDTVRPTTGGAHEYVAIAGGTSGATAANEPSWPTTPGGQVTEPSGLKWQERAPTMYPILKNDLSNYDNHNWLFEVMGNANANVMDDPWITMRSWGQVASSGATPHPFQYATSPPLSGGTPPWGFTHYFNLQTYDQRTQFKRVQIPQFNYVFWKDAALEARGQKGAKYLTWTSSGTYTDGVTTQSASAWLASGSGFMFFDTQNGLNPQNGGPGVLDPGSADPCGFSGGFVYGNFSDFGSSGCPGGGGYYPTPGEPYRDVGYRKVNEATSGIQVRGQWNTDAAGQFVVVGANNGQWDYQDLDWSNSTNDATGPVGTKNQIFDVFVAQKTVKLESTGTNATDWVPVEFYPGCKPGNNSQCPTCNCSEPHEPYLNLLYVNAASGFAPGWAAPTLAGQPKKTTPNNLPNDTPVTCAAADMSSAAGQAKCTTNAFDIQGGLVNNFFKAIHTVGVFYNEGNFSSTGNNIYFGSIVVAGTVSTSGTCNVYFDDRLLHGGWPPPGVPFPRVMLTSEQIE